LWLRLGAVYAAIEFGTVLGSCAFAQTLNIERALELIANTADRICNVVNTYGDTNSLNAKGNVKAQLNGLAAKLADVGIEGSASLENEQYQNVLRKDLANTLKDNAACKTNIFNVLSDKLLGFQESKKQQEKSNEQDETIAATPRPFNKAGLFVHSSVNSGYRLSDTLTRRLENLGLSLASDKSDNNLDVEIGGLMAEEPKSVDNGGRTRWTATVSTRIIIRQPAGNLVRKDFSATTNPATDSPQTAEGMASLQLVDQIADYFDSNRQSLNLRSR